MQMCSEAGRHEVGEGDVLRLPGVGDSQQAASGLQHIPSAALTPQISSTLCLLYIPIV